MEPVRQDSPAINMTVPHPARVYDYFLGGKDNFEVDRIAAEAAIKTFPKTAESARAARAFLRRGVPSAFSPLFSYRGARCGPAVTGGVQPMLPAAGLPIRLRSGLSRRRSSACAAARTGPPARRHARRAR